MRPGKLAIAAALGVVGLPVLLGLFLVGPYTRTIDATRLMWASFREHPRQPTPSPGGGRR